MYYYYQSVKFITIIEQTYHGALITITVILDHVSLYQPKIPIYLHYSIEICASILQFDTLWGACERGGVHTSILVLDEKIC